MSIWRPSTTAILITGVLAIIVAVTISFVVTNFKPTTSVKLGGGVFSLWIAKTEAARVTGLSGVEELKPNGGLLMAFASDDTWEIWMKDMKIPLDLLWLNDKKEITYIVKNVSPDLSTSKTFKPTSKARYVIELPAGSVQKSNINVGQKVDFEVEDIK